jgi:hypothetical protein
VNTESSGVRQFEDDTKTMIQQWQGVKSCESFNHTSVNLCIVKDTPNYMSEKQTTNLCSLKKRTLQTFLVDGLVYCRQSIS